MIFERRVELLCAGMKPLWCEGGGKVSLGDNTGRGSLAAFLFVFAFQLDSVV